MLVIVIVGLMMVYPCAALKSKGILNFTLEKRLAKTRRFYLCAMHVIVL